MDKANVGKRESSEEWLTGQRQTERQGLPLSFQRERKQTPSAERMTQSETAWEKSVEAVNSSPKKKAMKLCCTFQ